MKLKNVITSCGVLRPLGVLRQFYLEKKVNLNYHAGPAGEFVKHIAVLVERENRPIQLEIRGSVGQIV